MSDEPYKITPVWDEQTLPTAIRNEHSTKVGTWGVLRVLEGEVTLVFQDSASSVLVTSGSPALIPPEAVHHVELSGPMKMQVDFHHGRPNLA